MSGAGGWDRVCGGLGEEGSWAMRRGGEAHRECLRSVASVAFLAIRSIDAFAFATVRIDGGGRPIGPPPTAPPPGRPAPPPIAGPSPGGLIPVGGGMLCGPTPPVSIPIPPASIPVTPRNGDGVGADAAAAGSGGVAGGAVDAGTQLAPLLPFGRGGRAAVPLLDGSDGSSLDPLALLWLAAGGDPVLLTRDTSRGGPGGRGIPPDCSLRLTAGGAVALIKENRAFDAATDERSLLAGSFRWLCLKFAYAPTHRAFGDSFRRADGAISRENWLSSSSSSRCDFRPGVTTAPRSQLPLRELTELAFSLRALPLLPGRVDIRLGGAS